MTSLIAESELSPSARERLARLQAALTPERERLLAHPMYREVNSLARLRTFMEHHVFAVWDFMSLLKWLQRELTCVELPWRPRGDAISRRLINEIVLGEESDNDGQGGYFSHFEMYLAAMQQCGAKVEVVQRFLKNLSSGQELATALNESNAPHPAAGFVAATFTLLRTNSAAAIAASFALGREDLIPDMFRALVGELHQQSPEQMSLYRYYLERHIELDGDEHTPLALRMLANICGDDEQAWQVAEQAAISSLQARQRLWDGVIQAF